MPGSFDPGFLQVKHGGLYRWTIWTIWTQWTIWTLWTQTPVTDPLLLLYSVLEKEACFYQIGVWQPNKEALLYSVTSAVNKVVEWWGGRAAAAAITPNF